ncbi:hypothetical protein BH20ACT2_BH20ACT2_10300 [soil metagenome]
MTGAEGALPAIGTVVVLAVAGAPVVGGVRPGARAKAMSSSDAASTPPPHAATTSATSSSTHLDPPDLPVTTPRVEPFLSAPTSLLRSQEREIDVLAGKHGAGGSERVELQRKVLGQSVDVTKAAL